MRFLTSVLVATIAPGLAWAASPDLQVPPGFTVEIAAEDVKSARQMALSSNGTLYVGTLSAGKVFALQDPNGDGNFEQRTTVAKGLQMPSGVAWREGSLYVAALNRVLRIPDADTNLGDPSIETITDDLPDKRHHGWKFIGFGPDGKLYVPVGAPCNICLRDDPRFASILTMDPGSGETEVYASGVRNSVGFDWHPQTGALWFTDNGRDRLGDDVPAEEINVAPAAGRHFGFPYVHTAIDGSPLPDPEFAEQLPGDTEITLAAYRIQAHSAAIGIRFYAPDADAGAAFPESYRNALFIAEHGSWNRSSKVGYQVSVLFPDGTLMPFLTGFLQGDSVSGRPSDVLVDRDGSLLVADDRGNRIYRVRWSG